MYSESFIHTGQDSLPAGPAWTSECANHGPRQFARGICTFSCNTTIYCQHQCSYLMLNWLQFLVRAGCVEPTGNKCEFDRSTKCAGVASSGAREQSRSERLPESGAVASRQQQYFNTRYGPQELLLPNEYYADWFFVRWTSGLGGFQAPLSNPVSMPKGQPSSPYQGFPLPVGRIRVMNGCWTCLFDCSPSRVCCLVYCLLFSFMVNHSICVSKVIIQPEAVLHMSLTWSLLAHICLIRLKNSQSNTSQDGKSKLAAAAAHAASAPDGHDGASSHPMRIASHDFIACQRPCHVK